MKYVQIIHMHVMAYINGIPSICSPPAPYNESTPSQAQ